MINQIKSINLSHSIIFFVSISIFILFSLKVGIFTLSPLICLLLILSIGIAHGSLDHLKGKKLFTIYKINNIGIFYLIYLFISLLIISLWTIFPATTLIFFLLVASFHFGKEDSHFLINSNLNFNKLLFLLKGLLIVVAPLHFHFNETIRIFKLLLVVNENFYLALDFVETTRLISILIIISIISAATLFLTNYEIKKFTIFFDCLSVLILNYFLSPLLAFTIYFCFLHSIRHIINLAFELNKNSLKKGFKIFLSKSMPLTIITIILYIISLYLLSNYYEFDNAIFKVIFIGLASLTFPHILLEYFLEKHENK